MSADRPRYSVYGNEYALFLSGNRAETRTGHSEDEFICDGDSLEVCLAAARTWVDAQAPVMVIHNGKDVDSIVYHVANVCENEYDDDGELYETAVVDGASTLTKELLNRFEHVKRSFQDWLDYESDTYEEI